MIKILFLRNNKALYPEIDAYVDYFNKDQNFEAYDLTKLNKEVNFDEYDVLWEIKGFGGVKAKNKIVVHDYASLSVPPFAKLKNRLKTIINPKPDLRIFLNENVKSGFQFKDDIPYCLRDMGLNQEFINSQKVEKEYKFVYVGSVGKERNIDKFLKNYNSELLGKLCLIGPVENEIYHTYKENKDITFLGKIPYKDVPTMASKAEFGLNLIPDKYPYNLQTSTKLIEYLALGLKIVTTNYKWVREFEASHKCKFFKIEKDLFINHKEINEFDFQNNFKADEFLWDKVIENSRIKSQLKSFFG